MVTGEITQRLVCVGMERAEIPKFLFYSFMLSVTVTSRERPAGSVTAESARVYLECTMAAL